MSDVFNRWAQKSEVEKHLLRFWPGIPRWQISALEFLDGIGKAWRARVLLGQHISICLRTRTSWGVFCSLAWHICKERG